MVKNDWQLTVQKVAEELNMKKEIVTLILATDLNMKSVPK
jgi:hypothetical protein